jgi:hypothetical protein
LAPQGIQFFLTSDAHSPDLHLQVNGSVPHRRTLPRRDRHMTNHFAITPPPPTSGSRLVGAHPPPHNPPPHLQPLAMGSCSLLLGLGSRFVHRCYVQPILDLSYLPSAWLPSCSGTHLTIIHKSQVLTTGLGQRKCRERLQKCR